ncbi:uncharacterized protein J3R85_010877 [Psidium guajava]|nr:uncharacterized protein J3R85_010877 [Psidium guajava]
MIRALPTKGNPRGIVVPEGVRMECSSSRRREGKSRWSFCHVGRRTEVLDLGRDRTSSERGREIPGRSPEAAGRDSLLEVIVGEVEEEKVVDLRAPEDGGESSQKD